MYSTQKASKVKLLFAQYPNCDMWPHPPNPRVIDNQNEASKQTSGGQVHIDVKKSIETHPKRLVGLGIGLGVRPLLLTRIWREGEKHCCSQQETQNDTQTHETTLNHCQTSADPLIYCTQRLDFKGKQQLWGFPIDITPICIVTAFREINDLNQTSSQNGYKFGYVMETYQYKSIIKLGLCMTPREVFSV